VPGALASPYRRWRPTKPVTVMPASTLPLAVDFWCRCCCSFVSCESYQIHRPARIVIHMVHLRGAGQKHVEYFHTHDITGHSTIIANAREFHINNDGHNKWRSGRSLRLLAGALGRVGKLPTFRFKGTAAIVRYLTWIEAWSQIQPPAASLL